MKPLVVILFCVCLFAFVGCQPVEPSSDYMTQCAVEAGYVSMIPAETPKQEVEPETILSDENKPEKWRTVRRGLFRRTIRNR